MVKRIFSLVLLVLFLFFFSASCFAEDVDLPLDAFYAAIPDAVRDALPEEMLDADLPDGEAVRAAGSLSALLGYMRDALVGAIPFICRLFGRLFLCALFSALFSVISSAFGDGRTGEIARFCVRLSMAGILLEVQMSELAAVKECLRQLQLLVNAMLPVMAALLSAGGNTAAASAGCGSLLLFMNLGENLCAGVFFPLIAVSSGFSAVGWISGEGRLRGITAALKRITAWGLGLFGAVFSAVFSFQTVLSAGADSVAARTVKFAVGKTVPVIGGVVGDTVRTVASGLGYLKDTVGLLGILLLVLLVLPPLVHLVLCRGTLTLCSSSAELLGASCESKMLGEFSALGGILLALLCGAVLCFIFALVLFVRMTLALGA